MNVAILLLLTVVTGIVDAISFLGLGHVFTANMTGNIVLLGFALGGAPGLSMSRSLLALAAFAGGAVIGGRMGPRIGRACAVEALLLFVAAAVSGKLLAVVALSAVAMGLRNAVVRRLAVPDLTTTVLTLTVTGLAADSSLAGGENPRWLRRCGAILALLTGAALGTLLLAHSLVLALCTCGAISAGCALLSKFGESKGIQL